MSKAAIIALAIGLAPTVVFAQEEPGGSVADANDGLDDIIVTATRREANVQDIPIAVTALSGNRLIEAGITSSTDLAALTPGLQFTDPGGSPVAGLISIRGVSQNDFAGHIEPANAYYIDEVYQPSNATSVQQLYDVSRVEVLKGPQGTLFGRNATGGLIHVISNQPTDSLDGYVDVTIASYDQFRVEAALGGPLGENLTGRIAFFRDKHGGYIRNDIGPDVNEDHSIAGRVQLKFEPTSDLKINLFADIYRIRPIVVGGAQITGAAPDANGLGVPLPPGTPTGFGYVDADGDPYTGSFDAEGLLDRRTWTVGGKIAYSFGDLTLASLTSYQDLDSVYVADNDYSPFPIGIFRQNSKAKHFTQELRLLKETGDFRWTAGLYYLNIRGDYFQGFELPAFASYPRASYSVDTESFSGFVQGDYDLSSQVSITAGVRVTRDEKDYTYLETCDGPLCALFIAPGSLAANGLTTDKHGETDWSGRLSINWKPNDDVLLYASANRGYKAFNYNAGFVGQAPISGFRFDGENLMAYEIGAKLELFDRRVRFNSAAFYYDYSDYQAFDQRGFNFTLFNTSATIYGADFEVTVNPGGGFRFNAGLALLDTKVEDVPIGATLVSRDAPQAPDYTLNLGASKKFETPIGGLNISIDASYSDEFYAQLTNAPVTLIPGEWTVNARISLKTLSDHLDIALFADNVFDVARKTFSFDVSGPPLGGAYNTYARPRWIGGQIRYNF
ncbi:MULTISPECIES: TonB-dependent receptor [unclassified Sphingopyxis]|uniref:TonB-dependent receptor n=1 Tax=unclassified Sphingopyxis TaxID=2614943 RepID=UPI00285D5322|nr:MULTISPECIES: TonB-dependent receptor [unclassified Sphingopyxis]MDR6832438.1 iron complex outermembrane receptor protein [Sphingopyxis sp. BE122]MDR7228181.1 iron complex outermembrane receptor protein [Sphingopyxis sp. BE259]